MRAIAGLVLAVAAACGARGPSAVEPEDGASLPWCVRASGMADGVHQEGEACFETRAACLRARALALRWGGLADLDSVGACVEW